MGICNNTNEGHCELVFMICNIVLQKPRSMEEITSILNPDSTHINKPNNTVRTWKKLNLFKDDNDDIVDLSDYAKSEFDNFSHKNLKSTLAYVIRRVLFSKKNINLEDIWNTENGANDFFVPLSWFLIQNPFEFNMTSFNAIKSIMSKQIKKNLDREIIQNDTRYPGLIAYCHYLGFFSGNRKFNFIDPTDAILSDLDLVIQKNEEIKFNEFLKRLNDIMPVIDNGNIRLEVEKILDERYLESINMNTISPSLSLALTRLHELKAIKIISKGDAEISYNFSKKINERTISHIERLDG